MLAIERSAFLIKKAHVYNGTAGCAAFLANIDDSSDATITFNGNSYDLPAWSVSILPDCKNVIFNTAKVVSQKMPSNLSHGHKVSRENSLASSDWKWYQEQVGPTDNNSFTHFGLLEQLNTTKDTSDYLWYSISILVNGEFSVNNDIKAFLNVVSLGHAALLFVNKKVEGFGYGFHDDASFVINKTITLNQGNNTLDLLSMMVGVQDCSNTKLHCWVISREQMMPKAHMGMICIKHFTSLIC